MPLIAKKISKKSDTIMKKVVVQAPSTIMKYPELDEIADKITIVTGIIIDRFVHDVQSSMPYKEQYVLEKVIQFLQARV